MLLNFEHLKTFYSALKQKMKNFRGNWDQDDPTADDYIKNRPFYSEKTQTKVEVLPITTVVDDSTNAFLHFPFVKGQSYSITWDGKVYNCVAYEYVPGYLMLGNTAIYNEYGCGGIETDTGDPFVVESRIEDTQIGFYLPTDDDGSPHTVSIEILSEDVVVHKLDKKYLPDDIDNDITIYSSSSGWSGDLYWIDLPENVTFDYIGQAIDQGKNVYLNFYYNAHRYVFPIFIDLQFQQFIALGQDLEDPKFNIMIVFTADSLNFAHRGDLYRINAFAEVEDTVNFLFEHYSEPVQSDWNQTDETQPDYIKNKPVLNSNYIILTDQVNGYEYLVQMMGGNLVSFCKATSIEVTIPPTRTDFFEGEDIDLTGMMLTAICQDGSNRQIENYDYSPKVTAADTTQIDIVYEEGGVTYTTSIQIAIKNLAEALSNFEYTENANGTYTLTGWKEVVDGVARTELIAPNSNKIIV